MQKSLSIVVAIMIIGTQHYLSSRKHWIWGGIIPVLYTIFSVWFCVYKAPDFNSGYLIFMGIVLLGIWAQCRENYKNKINFFF